MNRRRFLQAMAFASVGALDARRLGPLESFAAAAPGRESVPSKPAFHSRRLATIGLYVAPPGKTEAHYYDFYHACGYNYLEFCEGGFGRRPDLLPAYHAELSEAVAAAHQKGFKVWLLLLAGMRQWQGPAESGNAGTFSARHTDLLHERLSFIRQAVRRLPAADGFEFFAGDPGGDPEGRSTVKDCIAFARQVQAIVREDAPHAGFALNLWAIAEWAGFPSPFSLDFWQKQVALSKAVAGEPDLLGPACGVVFSLDNYYRSLALSCYDDAGLPPELFPLPSDIRALRDRRVQPILGWPYFLVDECDDGFITPNNVATHGQSQSETRYIRAVIDQARQLGLDGLVANAAFVPAEPLNIYAFGRMCGSASLTPDALLEEYSRLLADRKTRRTLTQVLRFIENHSNWENSLPQASRRKPLDCGDITSPAIAQEKLARVVPRAKAPIPLPEPPALYLQRLQHRLAAIANGYIGGVAPIVRQKKAPERKSP
jgi:hypothetical protein